MRLGIGSYTYVWGVGVPGNPPPPRPMSPLELLDRAVALGVRVVQLCDNTPVHRFSDAELDALRKQADERGLELEYGTAGIETRHLRRQIDIAARLQARVLRVVIDAGGHEPSATEAREMLAAIVPDLERSDVTLAIENHDRFRADTLWRLIDDLRSDRIGACLDTANSFGSTEGPDVVLETLGPRAVCWHVKDFTVRRLPHRSGFVIEGCPAGQGQLDVPHWIARLRAMGSDVNAILELWPPPETDIAATIEKEARWAEQSVQYLRKLIAE